MAEISQYIDQIVDSESTGASIRMPIKNALNDMNDNGVYSVATINGNSKDDLMLKEEYDELYTYDDIPIENSEHGISSAGTYEFINMGINVLVNTLFPEQES